MAGALARLRQLDATSENLTHSSTPGYRQRRIAFESEVARVKTQNLNPLIKLTNRELPSDSVSVKSDRSQISNSAGAMIQTDRVLDVALEGPGFLLTNTPKNALTRDGRLRLDAQGTLVTRSGAPVLCIQKGGVGPLNIPPGSQINIDNDGRIVVGDQVLGSLHIVEVREPGQLRRLGGGLYAAQASDPPKPSQQTRVNSGFIEQSNADPLRCLVEMIAAQRGFELSQKVIETTAALDHKSALELGKPS